MSSICHTSQSFTRFYPGKTIRSLHGPVPLCHLEPFLKSGSSRAGVPVDSLYVSRYSVIQNVYTKKQTDGIATRHSRFTNSQGARAWRVARAGNRASNRADYKRRL